jgi:hypothetical protein
MLQVDLEVVEQDTPQKEYRGQLVDKLIVVLNKYKVEQDSFSN